MQALMIFITCPSTEKAAEIARACVEARVAACGNIVPAVRSIYRWQGEVQDEAETLLILKSSAEKYEALERLVRETHSYEVPEILAVPVDRGLPAYLAWMGESMDREG